MIGISAVICGLIAQGFMRILFGGSAAEGFIAYLIGFALTYIIMSHQKERSE